MADIFLKRVGRHLIPADEDSQTLVKKMEQGKVMRCKYSFLRNPKFHRKGFAMLHDMFDMQDHFDNFKHFREFIVIKAGYYTTWVAPNGHTSFQADSLSFGSMDNAKFEKVYNALIDAFLDFYGQGISREEFQRILNYS